MGREGGLPDLSTDFGRGRGLMKIWGLAAGFAVTGQVVEDACRGGGGGDVGSDWIEMCHFKR